LPKAEILSQSVVTLYYDEKGKPVQVLRVTYRIPPTFVSTVWLPIEKATEEEIKKAIKKDYEEHKKKILTKSEIEI